LVNCRELEMNISIIRFGNSPIIRNTLSKQICLLWCYCSLTLDLDCQLP